MLITHKSTFAKLLASENITVEYGNFQTASFDGKSRVLRMPTWVDEHIIDMMVGHEVGHALFTDFDMWKETIDADNGISHDLINIVEDIREERLMQIRFPGLRRDFVRGYKRLHELDVMELKGQTEFSVSDRGFLDRINIKGKMRNMVEVEFTPEEQVMFDACYTTETMGDVTALCARIAEYIKEKRENAKKDGGNTPEAGTDGNALNPSNNDVNPEPTKSNEDGGDNQNNTRTEESDDEESDELTGGWNGDGKGENKPIQTKGALHKDDENLTAPSLTSMEKNIAENLTEAGENVAPPIDPMTKEQRDYIIQRREKGLFGIGMHRTKMAKEFMQEQKSVVNSMVKEFEIRKKAAQYKKAKPTQTGQLDTNKLHQYRYNDEIFVRGMKIPTGKSHGMFMLVDTSGSMDKVLSSVMRQTVILAMFCRKANIPFAVYSFTSHFRRERPLERSPTGLDVDSVTVTEHVSSEMTNQEFEEGVADMLFGRLFMGGTPMLESLIAAQPLVKSLKERNNLDVMNLIVLADGSPHSMVSNQRDDYSRTTKIWLDKRNMLTIDPKVHPYETMDGQISDIYAWYKKTGAADRVMSFFIGDRGACYMRDIKQNAVPTIKKNTKQGYDIEIFIPHKSNSLKSASNEFEVEDDASNRKILGAFMKFGSDKKNTRIIVKEFITAIS